MKKRWIVGGVLAVLLGISATGIALNSNWLGGRWDASHAAADLESRLQKLDGVTAATAAYDPLGLPDPTVKVDVSFATDASLAQWAAASALVRTAASSAALAGTTSTVAFHEVKAKTSVTVEPLLFSPAAIASEIAAWRELRLAVGDRVSLHLGYATGTTGASGQLVREYTVRDADDARAVAARWPDKAPAVDPGLPTTWSSPGLQMFGMPSRAMMSTLSAVSADLPLAPADPAAKPTGTFAVIMWSAGGYKLTIVELQNGATATEKPTEKMARAAQAAFATGANRVEWQKTGGFSTLVLGDCPSFASGTQTIQTVFHGSQRDQAFAAELARLGFVLPAEVRAGECR